MKPKFTSGLLTLLSSGLLAQGEVSYTPVATTQQLAPGFNADVKFTGFTYIALADDGQVAFSGSVLGPGVGGTNSLGIWAGPPTSTDLIVRTGDPVPGAAGRFFTFVGNPNLSRNGSVAFRAKTGATLVPGLATEAFVAKFAPSATPAVELPPPGGPFTVMFTTYHSHGFEAVAGRADLSGAGIVATNNQAILSGPEGDLQIAARTGAPAPGTPGYFTGFPTVPAQLAVAPDATVAFRGTVSDGSATKDGIWTGKAGAIQAVALAEMPAPASLLGPGYVFAKPTGESVALNARGELAFAASLSGPGLVATNSEFVVAGKPGALRVIARSGDPAPGIPGARFQPVKEGGTAFSHAVIGTDGAVAFIGCLSTTGRDFGVWLAPADGSTPVLIMRTGQQAPGAAAGMRFRNSFQFTPPVESMHLNSRNQLVFRSIAADPATGALAYGAWISEPDGSPSLVAITGDSADVGVSSLRKLTSVTFGHDPEFATGPEDGRRSPFNDRGEVALWFDWQNPPGPPDFGSFWQGVYVARVGLLLEIQPTAEGLSFKFPSLIGSEYRLEHCADLSNPDWQVLKDGIDGTGEQVVVNVPSATLPVGIRFFRVVRTQ